VAEWLLSLTTSRDHACAIAGDLAQQSPQYGATWFWTSVMRTLVSLTWRAFTEAPLKVTGIACLALLLQSVYMIGISLWLAFMRLAFALTSNSNTPPVAGDPGFDIATFSPLMLEAMAIFFVTSYFIGKWIARRAPQRELAVYVAVWFLAHLIRIPLQFLTTGGVQAPGLSDLAAYLLATVGGFLSAFVGVTRVRRQRVVI
jgi:hypothetical protein